MIHCFFRKIMNINFQNWLDQRKVLGVPASEAEVERMFNISGQIFNPKRRSLGVDNYEN